MIADMIILLRVDKNEHGNRGPWPHFVWHYTCKNFDPVTKNCTAYETRPEMCRDYPYGNPPHSKGYKPRAEGQCNYRDCTRRCATPEKLEKFSEGEGEAKVKS